MTIDPNNLSGTASLTFSEEFNGTSLNLQKWETGDPWLRASGSTNTANGEKQWYTNQTNADLAKLGNLTVAGGALTIQPKVADAATQAKIGGYDYTSGMITTDDSFSQTYGYFEMRADLAREAVALLF
jgi:beta-glucanase (GH16 family)